MMSKNNKGGFSSVEVLLVVMAILVFAYCAAPVVRGVGRGLGMWMKKTPIFVPSVDQTGGGGFAAIQPGQSVMLTLSTSGMRLNDLSISDDQLQPVFADLKSRGVLADAAVTVIVDKDVRVLDRKVLLKRLEDQQVRYEVLEDFKAVR
jgi:hypothetical protein